MKGTGRIRSRLGNTGAPFPYHMYVFNADGTTQQANPDAQQPHSA